MKATHHFQKEGVILKNTENIKYMLNQKFKCFTYQLENVIFEEVFPQ